MNALYRRLSTFFDQPINHSNFSRVSGGSINQTYRLALADNKAFFCKINSASKFPHLFEKEKRGLELIARQGIIHTPGIIFQPVEENHQALILEWVEQGPKTKSFWVQFGEQLAALHHVTSNSFGLHENNYMGSVQQRNTPIANWPSFFKDNRLSPLVQQCLSARLLTKDHAEWFEKLYMRLPQLFTEEKPSLVHGDLWSGNFMCSKYSEPVLIDPAVYFGHRSVDLAMTTLFGGFDKSFYEAYDHHFPFPPNYKEQWEVCNLYPLLIHLLLFGKSYLYQVETTLKKYQ